jgi:peptide deformylase
MLEILRYPDPVLRQVSRPVEVIDDTIRRLAADMIEAMVAAKGVGLAAPQVGVPVRLVVVDLDHQAHDPRVLINPVFREVSQEKEIDNEGCLSLPGIEAKVKRSAQAVVEAQDLSGNVIEYSGDGIVSRALQHECDHLDGILFIDKLTPAARFAIRHELARLEEAYAMQERRG